MNNAVLLLGLFLTFQLCSAYTVYRNVKDYGATGNGRTDDSAAIIKALTDENRNSNPSTQTPAYVYFPGGTYLINQTLPLYYYTSVVGDPNNIPTIKFVLPGNKDIRVLEAEGGWYHDAPQNNFFPFC
jgi:glucan 1,3-beta-glucosidase